MELKGSSIVPETLVRIGDRGVTVERIMPTGGHDREYGFAL
jgi:hypothetical protein